MNAVFPPSSSTATGSMMGTRKNLKTDYLLQTNITQLFSDGRKENSFRHIVAPYSSLSFILPKSLSLHLECEPKAHSPSSARKDSGCWDLPRHLIQPPILKLPAQVKGGNQEEREQGVGPCAASMPQILSKPGGPTAALGSTAHALWEALQPTRSPTKWTC